MQMPHEYIGREHTWLKHRVLQLYLEAWAHKLGSVALRRSVRLWYVDCFAGPWRAQSEDLHDTSIHIGLNALESAASTWAKQSATIQLGAIFVEEDPEAFAQLRNFVGGYSGQIDVKPLRGSFEGQVDTIQRLIGSDAAFVFVDPTGWKGAAMRFIAPIVSRPWRDVLINVMFNDINRFKHDPRAFLREQMRDFFALVDSDIPAGLSEDGLMRFYRERLKVVCKLQFAADLSVPHPIQQRTKFRLVVGGHHSEVIRLFREVERRAVGADASEVRTQARERQRLARTNQHFLFAPKAPDEDARYVSLRNEGLAEAASSVPKLLGAASSLRYDLLWPRVLEECHITEADLKKKIWEVKQSGEITIANLTAGDRSLKAYHIVRLGVRAEGGK